MSAERGNDTFRFREVITDQILKKNASVLSTETGAKLNAALHTSLQSGQSQLENLLAGNVILF
jgi:hypothetical protein